MISPMEVFKGVELVWLIWLAGMCILAGSGIRAIRMFRRPRARLLHVDELGASYTMSYVFVIPLYMLFVCVVVETTLLLVAKVGTMYAAHAGARARIVWENMRPTHLADERTRQAIFGAMAPFTSSVPKHLKLSKPPRAEVQAGEFVLAYKLYAKAAEDQPAPWRPYRRSNPSYSKLYMRFMVAASRTTFTYELDRSKPDGLLRFKVTYKAPLYVPGSARILDPDGFWPYDYPIHSTVTLPNEAPFNASRTLGIDYESR